MKKLFFALALIMMTGIAPLYAQGPAGKPGTHMKKDGTPDRRYKDNKKMKAAAGPTKKDGTADMRYKANNANAGKRTPKK